MNEKKLKKIINHYGYEKQKIKAIEELAELQQELAKNCIGRVSNIKEEFADVWIMMNQLVMIFDLSQDEIKEITKKKIDRTIERIEKEW